MVNRHPLSSIQHPLEDPGINLCILLTRKYFHISLKEQRCYHWNSALWIEVGTRCVAGTRQLLIKHRYYYLVYCSCAVRYPIPRNSETFLSLWHLDWALPYMCQRSWLVLVPGLLWDNIICWYGDYICDVKVVAWWQAWIYNECVVKHMHRIIDDCGVVFFKCSNIC